MQEPDLNMTKDDKLVLLQEPYKHYGIFLFEDAIHIMRSL